jgi:hypothetical protein
VIRRLAESVVGRLRGQLPAWDVDHFPNAPERYSWAHANATLLVCFEASTYGDVGSLSPQSTDRDVDISVTVLARSLHGTLSITSALDHVRQALFGWEPVDAEGKLGFGAMRPIRETFVSEEQGVWRFSALYRSAVPVVADIDPLSGVPLEQVTFKEPT